MLCDRVRLQNIPLNRPKVSELTATSSERVCGYANPKVRDVMHRCRKRFKREFLKKLKM